jgi:hypothetical protein
MTFIPRPIYKSTFKFVDRDCQAIGTYLYEEINTTFYPAIKGNIIKTARFENDPLIPITDFPVLKVYKSGLVEETGISPQMSTKFTIAYALAYTQRTKIASVGTYVAEEIFRLLKNGSMENRFQLDWSVPLQVVFEDFISPDNVIYKYTTVSANIYTVSDQVLE